jgi:hypothetical protein
MNHIDQPLADWERELLGHEKVVTVCLTVTHHDGTETVIDGIDPQTFVWVALRTESNDGWRNDGPLVLSVMMEDGEGPIHYLPNVHKWTTESTASWRVPK